MPTFISDDLKLDINENNGPSVSTYDYLSILHGSIIFVVTGIHEKFKLPFAVFLL